MIEGLNAMERLGYMMANKNSRICAEFDIDSAPKSFREKFQAEELCDEIVYEYAVSYFQIIQNNIPAVKIVAKERGSLYWHIAELAKELGFFVICEIGQEELGYIIENKTKIIAENKIVDAVIINVNLYDNDKLQILQFLELLKKSEKGAFIKARDEQKKSKKRWLKVFAKKEEKTLREQFSKLQTIEQIGHDENGQPTYSMVGVAITREVDHELLHPYTFSLVCNYEEKKLNEVVHLFDGQGQGALILINFNSTEQENWSEAILEEVIQKSKRINNAINEFYGIED